MRIFSIIGWENNGTGSPSKHYGVIKAETKEEAEKLLPGWKAWYREVTKSSLIYRPPITNDTAFRLLEQDVFGAEGGNCAKGTVKNGAR